MPPNFYLYEILWGFSRHPGNEPRRAVVDLGRAGAAELVSAGRRGAGLNLAGIADSGLRTANHVSNPGWRWGSLRFRCGGRGNCRGGRVAYC